jgi:hypothetical protein
VRGVALTIDDLAAHLNLPGNVAPADPVERGELQRHLDSALERVGSECDTAVDGVSTVPVSSGGSIALLLPVVRIDSVDAVVDPDGNPITPTRVDVLAGVVWVPVSRSGVWQVTVTATAARVSLELATLIIAGHLYETQRRTRPQARPGAPGPQGPTGAGYAIPHRAAELMAPHRLPGIA